MDLLVTGGIVNCSVVAANVLARALPSKAGSTSIPPDIISANCSLFSRSTFHRRNTSRDGMTLCGSSRMSKRINWWPIPVISDDTPIRDPICKVGVSASLVTRSLDLVVKSRTCLSRELVWSISHSTALTLKLPASILRLWLLIKKS